METKFKKYIAFSKTQQDQQIVGGYASTSDKDHDGDEITLDAIKKAWPDYIKFGNIREQHDPEKAVGVVETYKFDDLGVYIKAHIVDKDTWEKIKAGVLKGFSISGDVIKRVGNKITEMSLCEISVVDRPNNPTCVVDLIKATNSKKINKEKQMSIHKDFADVHKAMEEAAALAPAVDEKDEAKHEAYRMALEKVQEAMKAVEVGLDAEGDDKEKQAEPVKEETEKEEAKKDMEEDASEDADEDSEDEDEEKEEAKKEEAKKVKREEAKKSIKVSSEESKLIKAMQKKIEEMEKKTEDLETKMKLTKTVTKSALPAGVEVLEKNGERTSMNEIAKALEDTEKDTPLEKISKAHARADFIKWYDAR